MGNVKDMQCGVLVRTPREITFHQGTSKGTVFCRVTVPIAICAKYGFRSSDEAAEAIIEEVVKREIEKLP
jgi:hypothetical protein